MKRAGIYFFYDKDGVVDKYVPYFIQELRKVVNYIVVVVNGKLLPEGRRMLLGISDDLFVRENQGFDVWAYKEALEYIGWDQLYQFDQLVLTNFTIYGPIFPFEQVFERMDASDCDFWGMHTGYEVPGMKDWGGVPLRWGYKPDFIFSNFRVFKSDVLHSYEFRDHWNNLPPIRNYYESGIYHEVELPKKLVDAGFLMGAADGGAFRHRCTNVAVYGAYDMITEFQVPIIRKKAFYDPNGSLDKCTDIPRRLMRFIEQETDYDCKLIWENLLRTTNQYDLKNWFNWNTILPLDKAPEKKRTARVAVIFHNYYIDIVDQYFHNIAGFPDGTHLYVTTDSQEKEEELRRRLEPYTRRYQVEYRLVENRGRDVSALLVGCRDIVLDGGYDLICFMHDKKGIGGNFEYSYEGKHFSDCCFENIAPTAEYVSNVIDLFERQPRLGIAVPPPPRNETYYKVIGGSWGRNYANTQKLLAELNICVPLDEKKPPVAPYGTVFWFRPEALWPLLKKEWSYSDFDGEPAKNEGTISNAIERAYSLAAQGSGYYPSVIMSAVYAEQEVTRMTEIAHTYIEMTMQYAGSKRSLRQATAQFLLLLRRGGKAVPNSKTSLPGNAAATYPKVRGPVKRFIRGICPIGLWNLFRRVKCAMIGGVYVEPQTARSPFKAFIRACMPRAVWDQLRKAKCRGNGWVFVPED